MITGAWDRFWLAGGLWLVTLIVIECIRITRTNRLPWWIVHGTVIAWGAVALIPWFIALRSGVWIVPAALSTVPLELPATYGFTLLALLGLAVVAAVLALRGQRAAHGTVIQVHTKVLPKRAFITIVVLFVLYVISLPSLSSLWRLSGSSGEDLYGTSQGSFLGLSLIVLTVMEIGYLARRQPVSKVGIGLYFCLLVVALGSAHRYLVIILALSYVILRHPFQRIRGSLTQKVVCVLIGAAAVLAHWVFWTRPVERPPLRHRYVELICGYTDDVLIVRCDGLSRVSARIRRRASAIGGSSYLALPGELIPRALLGSKSTPPAAQLEQSKLGTATGASAPLWIEGVLNLGGLGDFLSMVVVAGVWGLLLRKALSSRRRIGATAAAIGPAWLLFAYQALSRLLIIAAIQLLGSIIIGLLIWNWIQLESGALDVVLNEKSGGEIVCRELPSILDPTSPAGRS